MKKGKRILACILAVGLIIGLAGCGSKSDSKGGDKSYIIATDTTFAPFEFTDDKNNFVGVDVDILAAIAKDQGFDYELQSLGFDAAVAALESGQADGVIAGMSITDERKKKYDFSDAYYDSGVVMAIKADDNSIKTYEDLSGKKVACKTGTEGATFAESIKDKYGFEIAYFKDSPKMYEDVKTGNTVACFEDYPVMGYGISQGNGLKMVTDMEKGSSYGFAVLKGKNAELLKMFDEGLKNIKASGEYQKILDKYIANK
ncbi:transporter substrate-binding domain-containing protein [uncultured Anaerofustis sp.]|uniref:transporter substrate-binding domain-containing protein n=1 Tax=uncultured Anaerofustis sp. TaxID=904996 RepID=UPI0025EADCEC|nr:transporter substrate-binding domain-containing protein [uncultured Anaerofustis sp.]